MLRTKGVLKPFSFIVMRWLLVFLWTLLVGYLLLWPSKGTPVEDISTLGGGTDLTDAIGHCGLAFIEALLVYSVLYHYLPVQRARRWTLVISLLLGFVLEVAQHWIPSRGLALLDIGANWLGVGMSMFISRKIPLHD